MSSSESRLDALRKLAQLLGAGESVLAEVTLAWNEPKRYVQEHAERLSDRGIDKPIADLAFIALCDALEASNRCREIDWRADPEDMLQAVRSLRRAAEHDRWKAPKLDDGEELPDLLRVVGSSLEVSGISLCQLDHQSDSYALVLLRTDQVENATALAQLADVGRFVPWRADTNVKPPPPLRLRTVEAIDVESAAPPQQVIALPGRRLVTFDGRTLTFVRSDGTAQLVLDAQRIPDLDRERVENPLAARAAAPQHALFRSGQSFGVVSAQYVHVWSPQGEASLYRNDPPLTADDHGAIPRVVRGGQSDDPKVVVAVCHRASAASDEVHPVVLRLNEKKKTASFTQLNQQGQLGVAERDRLPMSNALRLDANSQRAVQLGSIAWLDDALYIVATGREENSPSYAVYCRYEAPFGQLAQLVDLGESCTTRVSSSRAYLLASYPDPERKPRTIARSLAELTRPPSPLELPNGAVLLDHEDDAFWYFERRGERGRYVLGEPD